MMMTTIVDTMINSKLTPTRFSILQHSASPSHRRRRRLHLLPNSPPPLQIFFPWRRRDPGTPFRRLHRRHCFTDEMDLAAASDPSIGSLEVRLDDLAAEMEDLPPAELVATRCLPPAVTIGDAVDRIKAEVEKLAATPPRSKSGVLRIQIAVPPSVKALNWLYSQQKFFTGTPQFFVLREQLHDPVPIMACTNAHIGVSGIGAAICFHGSSHPSKVYQLIGRYLSFDSRFICCYGCTDFNFKKEEAMSGFHYFFIPQIELDELENCSLLASTLVWDDYLSFSFEAAVESLNLNLYKIMPTVLPFCKYSQEMWLSCISGWSTSAKVNYRDLVCLTAETLVHFRSGGNICQQDGHSSYLSFLRISPNFLFSTIVLSNLSGARHSIKESSNINHMWASLIVEECVRLGVTYFCIAPGSRSSPLAISACRHPSTTCISCFDERALAFHAVGYARGSLRPAVVITSSGTAVSNLLPAVVEASYAFVPILLLTADRPPELLDTGANQAISQVEHFSSFVRFFFNLPVPSDEIPARMVLTTVDYAIYMATQSPRGPVHVNCQFREPLNDYPSDWDFNCLKGLDLWISVQEPFTKYANLQVTDAHRGNVFVSDILKTAQNATNGILIFGDIEAEDDVWAALLLARHLTWPVIADVCSSIRIRRALTSFPDVEESFVFVDYLDHALLSNSVKSWLKPDVVMQIGTRITSKRIGQFLESCSLHSYILVDKHPCRHDPSHIVTHRIQSSIAEFVDVLLHSDFKLKASTWNPVLKVLNMMVSHEIAFQISSEYSLTEPHVARIITENLPDGSALFVGNSMVIRDIDMYGSGWVKALPDDSFLMSNIGLQLQGILVTGNRGASGIDGLLSTAIGFAAGCRKQVFCLLGDVSFLHDTNALAILGQRMKRKPMTIIVTNNHGGAIFSLLPVADTTESRIMSQYFYTSHDVSISKLCAAHSMKHMRATTKMELQHALWDSQLGGTDCIIEVESSIEKNAEFHSILRNSVSEVANHTMNTILNFRESAFSHDCLSVCKVIKMEFLSYRIELCSPLTSSLNKNGTDFYREGFILSLYLDDGSLGFGEVAPIEIHKETIFDVEEQLKFLVHRVRGFEISHSLTLLNGSFSYWLWRCLGVPPSSIFPSVRCGVEMAFLNALAQRHGSSLAHVLIGNQNLPPDDKLTKTNLLLTRSQWVQICALVDCEGTPSEVAQVVSGLVGEGFSSIKLKVARRKDPMEDAMVIREIRQIVGNTINIRVDANRRWTFKQAVQFGTFVKNFNLEYIEEPVQHESDIVKFCEETGVSVALDETIHEVKGDLFYKLRDFTHPNIVAVIIKPSVLGGFENASLIAKWAQQHEKMAVISSTFESGLSLSAYIQFAHFIEQQNATICRIRGRKIPSAISHGFGTFKWLKEDVGNKTTKICARSCDGAMKASIVEADAFLRNFEVNQKVIKSIYQEQEVISRQMVVDTREITCSIKVQELGHSTNNVIVVFLHGLFGTSEDWIPTMKALSSVTSCIAVDLPGHGESHGLGNLKSKQICDLSVELVASILHEVICGLTIGRVVLVGYSLGARIALDMALKFKDKICGAVLISGSPGLHDETARRIRNVQDEARARCLLTDGLEAFLETWYSGELWRSLRSHPHFKDILKSRGKHNDILALADSISGLSVGKQRSLWGDLKHCKTPLLLVVGEMDKKFREISEEMLHEINGPEDDGSRSSGEMPCQMFVAPECGHAAHLENPLPVINAVRKFIVKLTGC